MELQDFEFSAERIKQMFGISTDTLKSYRLEPRVSGQSHLYDIRIVRDAWYSAKKQTDGQTVITPEGDEIDRNLEEARYTQSRRIAQDLKERSLQRTNLKVILQLFLSDFEFYIYDQFQGLALLK